VTVIAPPQPSHDELEALIEEARRRTRRRRLIIAAAAAVAAAIGGGVLAVIVLTGGGGSATSGVPAGFHLVQARGPVAHAKIVEYPPLAQTIVDVATGRERSAPLVLEVWWDQRSGFDRVVGRIGGRVEFDTVGQTCQRAPSLPSGRFCLPPPPFILRNMHYRWPVDPNSVRVVGKGTFRGHRVIWLEGLVNGRPHSLKDGGDRVALDALTHRPVAKRTFVHGRLWYQEVYSVMSDLPASSVSFVVPDSGAADGHSFPPSHDLMKHEAKTNLRAARAALGVVPLWLGPRFLGGSLRSVKVGTETSKAPNGVILRRAKFLLLDYGTVTLREYGREKPFGFLHGPRPGEIVVDGRAILSLDGLLVFAEPSGNTRPIDRAAALALAKALRPVPSR
jgi:hypothetical protein